MTAPLPPKPDPTHLCKVCGALWIKLPPTPLGGWSLYSKKAGPCCDNAAMGEQIEPLTSFKRNCGPGPWDDPPATPPPSATEVRWCDCQRVKLRHPDESVCWNDDSHAQGACYDPSGHRIAAPAAAVAAPLPGDEVGKSVLVTREEFAAMNREHREQVERVEERAENAERSLAEAERRAREMAAERDQVIEGELERARERDRALDHVRALEARALAAESALTASCEESRRLAEALRWVFAWYGKMERIADDKSRRYFTAEQRLYAAIERAAALNAAAKGTK